MENFLNSYKVIVCAGTGGVGKTTVSASLGVLAAKKGIKTLVLTIDPARRLASALGMDQSDEISKVPLEAKAELWAGMIHAEKIFEDFVRNTAPNAAAAERLIRNPLYQQMATTLSGSQEFTSLERVLSALESNQFELVILDTPPSQHAIDFLRAPQKIYNLFQDSVTKWFVKSESSSDFLSKIFNQGTRTALSALQKLTGAKFIDELSDFFESIAALQVKVRERSIRLHQMLSSSETGFFLITGADEVKLKEASEFKKALQREGHHFSGIVLNRTLPQWVLKRPEHLSDEKWNDVEKLFERMKAFYSSRERAYDNLKQQGGQGLILKIPEINGSLSGVEALSVMASQIEESFLQEQSYEKQ